MGLKMPTPGDKLKQAKLIAKTAIHAAHHEISQTIIRQLFDLDDEDRGEVLRRIHRVFHSCGARLNAGGFCPTCER